MRNPEVFHFEFYKWEKKIRDRPFLRQPFGDKWEEYTWSEVGQMGRRLANGLKELGLKPKSHIGIISKNCREWVIADLAIIMGGFVSVPFFPTLSGRELKEVLTVGDVDALFIGKLDDFDDMKTGIPEDLPIIKFPHYNGNAKIDIGLDWFDLINRNAPMLENVVLAMNDIWSIIFTSGTTGKPKGVVIDYRALDSTQLIMLNKNPLKFSSKGNNHFFSYLPLNHIAERMLAENACFHFGGSLSFCESIDRFPHNLRSVKPTVFFGVPRIYTKFQQAIQVKMPQKKIDTLLKLPVIAALVKRKIKKNLGMSRTRVWSCGAAPLSVSQKLWFQSIGMPITEGYGSTETSGFITVLLPQDKELASVGQPMDGVKAKADPNTGEILINAPWLMKGYYKDLGKTHEVLHEGWYRTGDQGYIDPDGFVFLTGRLKDTFKTSKGKFIIPAPMEWELEQNELVEQTCICGIGCDQPMALAVLSENTKHKSKEYISNSLESTLDQFNKHRKGYQAVSAIVVMKEQWSIANNLLTPTLKVKRNELNNQFKSKIQIWAQMKGKVIFEA